MISIRNLRLRWPRATADTIAIDTLDVAGGEAVFLHGPGGCGKSALPGPAAGGLVAQQGEPRVLGHD